MEKLNPMMLAAASRPQIIHAIRGRVRIHLPCWPIGDPRQIEARLLQIPGVRCVRANPRTSNVLIHFDPWSTCPATLADALRSLDQQGELAVRQPGDVPHAADGKEQALSKLRAACANNLPAPVRGTAGGKRAVHPIRGVSRKVRPALRHAHYVRRTAVALKMARDIRPTTRRSLAGGEALWLAAGTLLTPGSAMGVVRRLLGTRLGLDRLFGRDLAEFLLRAADVLINLFCGGLPGILERCFDGLLLLADVVA